MIALKTIASGSAYFAVNSKMSQSYMSTELPLKSGARFVFNGSEVQPPPPASFVPPSLLELEPLPHAVTTATIANANALNPMQAPYLLCARSCRALHDASR